MSVDINRYQNQANVDYDIDYTIALMDNKRYAAFLPKNLTNKSPYDNYSSLFDFGNEDMTGYLPYFDDIDSCLVVGGSGDQGLNLASMGANKIDYFDKNFLVKYLIDLKIAAILTLSYNEFNDFFDTFDAILFAKLKPALPPESQYYWEKVYSKTRELNVATPEVPGTIRFFLFDHKKIPRNSRYQINNYLKSEKEYLKLRAKITKCIIRFIPADFYELENSLDSKYGTILLSNILEFLPDGKDTILEEIERYFEYIRSQLFPRLTDKGKILLSYFYMWDDETRNRFIKEYEKTHMVCQDGELATPENIALQARGLTSRNLLYKSFEDILPKEHTILATAHHLYEKQIGKAHDRAIIYSKKRIR